MANLRFTPFGVVVELDHSNVHTISTHLNTAAASVGTLAGVLAAMGVTGPASAVSAIISGVFWLGSSALVGCDTQGRGTDVIILWVGVPWCNSR